MINFLLETQFAAGHLIDMSLTFKRENLFNISTIRFVREDFQFFRWGYALHKTAITESKISFFMDFDDSCLLALLLAEAT